MMPTMRLTTTAAVVQLHLQLQIDMFFTSRDYPMRRWGMGAKFAEEVRSVPILPPEDKEFPHYFI